MPACLGCDGRMAVIECTNLHMTGCGRRIRFMHAGPASAAGSTEADANPPCLWAVVRFGDNIEDEWFVTFLLMEMTRKLPNISIQVRQPCN